MENNIISIKQKKEFGFDIIRFFSTLIVVSFHFSCYLQEYNLEGFRNYFFNFANGDFGDFAVTLFFMLSGATIWINNENTDIKSFYKKRWKSIFPLFYFCYIPFAILRTIKYRSLTCGKNPFLFLLTIAGLDGFLEPVIHDSYFLIGEWFLGAIILVYAVFPLLRFFVKKNIWITGIVLTIPFIYIQLSPISPFPSNQDFISCLYKFFLGIVFVFIYRNTKIIENKITIIVASIVSIILFFVKLPLNKFILTTILSFLIFTICFSLCRKINLEEEDTKKNLFIKLISAGCKISFTTFLIHHKIEAYSFPVMIKLSLPGPVLYLLTLTIVIISSIIVYKIYTQLSKILKPQKKIQYS